MGDAQRGDDAIAYYAATLGLTRRLSVTELGGVAQLVSTDGRLEPGRWLLHLGAMSNGATMWIRMGKFNEPIDVSADVPAFPMSTTRIAAIEVNVRKGDNDTVAAVITGPGEATGELYLTQISRVV